MFVTHHQNFNTVISNKFPVLLGLPHAYYTQSIGYRSGKPNQPVAQETRLGWTIFGGGKHY